MSQQLSRILRPFCMAALFLALYHAGAAIQLAHVGGGSQKALPQATSTRIPELEGLIRLNRNQGSTRADDDHAPIAVPEPSDKATRYYRSGNIIWFLDKLWALLIPAFFLITGLSRRVREWAARFGRRWFFTVALYVALFSVLTFIIDLPWSFYREYLREHAYGLSYQPLGKWGIDSLKGLMIQVVAGVLFIWIPYLLIQKRPRRWWLLTGLLVPFLLGIAMWASPIWIDPLFNEFESMKNRALETKILDFAARAGIDGSRVYEVNRSVDTGTVTAYATGFAGTKRIVLSDTIIAKLSENELMFVVGHEIGHYVLHHVVKSILFSSLLALVGLYFVDRLARQALVSFGDRFGFERLGDIASLPLLLLLLNLVSLVAMPVGFAYSRYQEREADRFGLEITQKNRPAATAFLKQSEDNLDYPRPGLLHKWWRSTHPSIAERIDFCNTYHPWKAGERLRYGHLFR